jgi:mannosyltransferase OCH1-like enzyme
MTIPRKLHFIWVGDEFRLPADCIRSWRDRHPGWCVRVWGNDDLEARTWVNQRHIGTFLKLRKWAAVADLMRYEILYEEGGVYADADSTCLRPLDDWLLMSEMFACWTNEFEGKPLVSNGFLGSVPRNPFLKFVIDKAAAKRDVLKRWSWSRMRVVPMGAWRSVGPHHLTQCIREADYDRITILPSHMFLPRHYRGRTYQGGGVVYADHFWGTTTKSYQPLAGEAAAALPAALPARSAEEVTA